MRIAFFVCGVCCSLLLISFARIPHAGAASTVPAPATRTNAKDGAAMVWVPAGTFLMGVSDAEMQAMLAEREDYQGEMFSDERPQRQVALDGYWIYKNLVTVAQYRQFCQATKREMPDQPVWVTDDRPVVNVSWVDAQDYATWAGAVLPTEAEWEKAARGTDGRRFPWGDNWSVHKCNNMGSWNPEAHGENHEHQTTPVGSYPAGASPYGALDMAGNVWEWCRDWYAEDYYHHAPRNNPLGPEKGDMRVMRGGSAGSTSKSCRTTVRLAQVPDDTMRNYGGFRCAVESPRAGDQ